MANDYGNDPVKERARLEIYKFAHKHLPRDISKGTAVYMASTNDRESFWLDKLGIPRENRVILEGNVSKVEDARKANPGIEVLPITTTRFFEEEAKNPKYSPFWYCGLDYECMLTSDVVIDLKHISFDELLYDGGVFYTNLVGQREQDFLKKDYLRWFYPFYDVKVMKQIFGRSEDSLFSELKEIGNRLLQEGQLQDIHSKDSLNFTDDDEIYYRMFGELLSTLPAEGLQTLREYVITRFINSHLYYHVVPLWFFDTASPGSQDIFKRNQESVNGWNHTFGFRYAHDKIFARTLKTISETIPEIQVSVDAGSPTGIRIHVSGGIRNEWGSLEENTIKYYEKGGFGMIPIAFKLAQTRGYTTSHLSPLTYTSSRNTKMMLDIFQVRKLRPTIKEFINYCCESELAVFYTLQRPYLVKITDVGIEDLTNFSKATRLLKKISVPYVADVNAKIDYISNMLVMAPGYDNTFLAKRLDLGSSFKQPLTLSLARKCVRKCMSNEEIAERFQVGDNWGTIASLRAHLTMGTLRGSKSEKLQPTIKSKQEPKFYSPELPKRLIPEGVYRVLPECSQKRIDYFMQEVLEPLHHTSQRHIRRAFQASELSNLLTPDIAPVRVYAFFDDVAATIRNGETIRANYLTNHFEKICGAETLTPVVSYPKIEAKIPEEEVQPTDSGPKNGSQSFELTESIKDGIREMIRGGFSKDEVWGAYQQYFSSKKQFGAVIAWASPNLAKKRKKR